MNQQPIDLAINGRFLMQPTTGVQRVARELTRAIDRVVADGEAPFRLRLLHQTGASAKDLELEATEMVEVRGPPGRIWEHTSLPRSARRSWLLCLGNIAPLYSLVRGEGVALMIHDLSYRSFPSAYRPLYRGLHTLLNPLLLRYANPIITVSQTEKRVLSKLAPRVIERIVVAQNGGWRDGVTHEQLDTSLGSQPRYGLYVGSFSARKNFEGVIQTAIQLVREDGLEFRIVGSTSPVLQAVNVDLPSDVVEKIHFMGQVENLNQLAAIYRGADFLLFPSFYEASPLPPLEAMRFGCAVVASDTAAMRERCGDAAEYCDPSNIGSIIRAVRRVTRDEKRKSELVARGTLCAERYSWRSQALTVLSAIEQKARQKD